MTNRFLSTSGANTNLSNGSADIFVNSVAIADISASLPVKTNAVRGLIAQRLAISDTTNLQTTLDSKLSNPLTATIDYQGFGAVNILQTTYNKVATPASPAVGKVSLFVGVDGLMRKIDENGVVSIIDGSNPFDQSLNTGDSVQFANVTIPNGGTYKGLTALLVKTDTHKTIETASGGFTQIYDSAGNLNPSVECSTLATSTYSPDHLTRISMENAQLTYRRSGIDRIVIDGFTTTIRSQDSTVAIVLDDDSLDMNAGAVSRLGFAEAGATHAKSADGLSVLSITNTDLSYTVGAQDRIEVTTLLTQITSPDGQSYFFVDDDSVEIGVDSQNLVRVDTAGVYMSGYNNQMDMQITDSANGLLVQDQTGARFEIKTAHSRLYPLDEAKGFLELVDTSYRFTMDVGAGVIDRFRLDGSDTRLISPNGLNAIISEDTGIRLATGVANRMIMASTFSSVIAPTVATTRMLIQDASCEFVVANVTRFKATTASITIIYDSVGVSNITLDTQSLTHTLNGSVRMVTDVTNTRIFSPDVGASLKVANSLLKWDIGANTYFDIDNVGTVKIGNQTGSTHYTLPNSRGLIGQSLMTDGAGNVAWTNNSAWSAQFGGNVSSSVLRFLPVSGTSQTGTDTGIIFSDEVISPFACTLRNFTWSSNSSTATTVMRVYINGVVSVTSIALTGAQGAMTTSIAIGSGNRIAIAWDPTGGGVRPDNITVNTMFY